MMELPEGCIAAILSYTTPEDACKLSLVSKSFRSAADSDVVWDHFLPADSYSIVSQSPSLIAHAPSKKALYLALSDHPVIIDEGKKSFQLNRKSGKKCYILGAKALSINAICDSGWTPQQRTLRESRFPVVAEIRPFWCPLIICGMINTLSLSPSTQYVAFLVFKIIHDDGLYVIPMELSISIEGGREKRHVCLKSDLLLGVDPVREEIRRRLRRLSARSYGGWLEIEMGEFFNSGFENKDLHVRVVEINRHSEASLIIEGIELRPKEDNETAEFI